MRGPRAAPAFVASLHMLRTRPVVTLSLGAAIVLSLLSVCCGLGLFTTPWFLCELFAVQIALCTGRPIVRGLSFIPAGLIMLGAVLVVSAVAWIALLGTGPELSIQTPRLFNFAALMRSGGFYAGIASALTLLVIAPLLYAPLLLIEQHCQYDRALVESVRLVVRRGVSASVQLSLLAHTVQVAPLLIATLLGLWLDPSQFALFLLSATPLLCASVPVGQGMIVWAYTQVREAPPAPPDDDPAVRAGLRATGRYARAWSVLISMPIAALLLLGVSLVRPSRVPLGAAPPAARALATLTPSGEQTVRVVLPNTALEVNATRQSVNVAASDGGGAGGLPLRAAGAVTRVRVLRLRDAYAIEIEQAGRTFVTWIDRAGVRLDDDLRARLLDRVGPWQLIVMLAALFGTSVMTVPILNDLGRVQRGCRQSEARRPSADVLVLDLQRSLRRARWAAGLLLPLSIACVAIAARAVWTL